MAEVSTTNTKKVGGSADGDYFGASDGKIAFFGATPVVQQTSASFTTTLAATTTTTATTTALQADIDALRARVNRLMVALNTKYGLIGT